MMGRQTTGNLVDGLGRHVACFGGEISPRHLKGADLRKNVEIIEKSARSALIKYGYFSILYQLSSSRLLDQILIF
jgi:hypothetical protein